MRTLEMAATAVGAAFVILAGTASADDPKFAFGKKDEIARLPPWAASGQAGFSRATGYQSLANPRDTFTEFVLVHKLL